MDKFFPGNIYHQFESICRDVDEFVTKDTLKFVENRVQGVGMTVKRFCSNVVQDRFPLSGDIEKPKSQLVDAEQVGMLDRVSVPDINTNSACSSEKKVCLNQESVHILGDSDDHITQTFEHPCGYLSPRAEASLHMAEFSDAIIQNVEESGVEEDITRYSVPEITNSGIEPLDNEVFPGVSNEDHEQFTLTLSSLPAFPSHEVDLTAIEEETQHFNHQKGNESDLYDPDYLSDSSSNGRFLDSKLKLNEEGNRYSDENGNLSSPSVSSANKFNEDNSLLMDSPVPSVCDANANALVKDSVLSDHFSTEDDNFIVPTSVKSPLECMLSHFSWEGKEVETGITPPCCFVMESTSADSICKTENIHPVHSVRDGLAVNISTPFPITSQNETQDVLPSFPILKSNDNYVTETDKAELVNASSDRHKQHRKDCHSEMLISPSESEHCGNFNMETVDLSSDLKDNATIPEMSITPSRCCVMKSTSFESVMKTENICPLHSERDASTVNSSSPFSIKAADETKDVDVLPFSILKPNDNNVMQTDKSELVNASSDRHKKHHGHSEILMSPSETANTCGDLDMETIDLSSDLKGNGTILVSKSSCVHPASRRRSFRYYKNLIHDAFTSRKRISKEYEHLAILYGDIDMETNQLFNPISAPSVLNTHSVKTQSSEWELISKQSFI